MTIHLSDLQIFWPANTASQSASILSRGAFDETDFGTTLPRLRISQTRVMPERHVVTTLAALPPGAGKAFMVATRRLAFFNVDGRVFAIDDVCPHDGAPLSEGMLDGATVICPWHNAEFDVTCGKVLCPPAAEDVKCYPVFVNGDSIEVEL